MNFVYLLAPGGYVMKKMDRVAWPDLRDSEFYPDYFIVTETKIRFRGSPFKVLEKRGSMSAGAKINKVASMLCGEPIFGTVNIVYDSPACKVVENAALSFIDGICSLLAPLAGGGPGEYDVDVFMLRAGYDKIINGLDKMIEAENNCDEWEGCFDES